MQRRASVILTKIEGDDGALAIPDGIVRVTLFLPLHDPVPLMEGKYLLLGDPIFPELGGHSIVLADDAGETIELPGSTGYTPIEVRVWRLSRTRPGLAPELVAISEACRLSGLVAEAMDQPSDSLESYIQVVLQISIVCRSHDGNFEGDPLEDALTFVQRLQTSYNMSRPGPPLRLLTQEQLPFLLPIVISPGPPAPLGPGKFASIVPHPMTTTAERYEWSAVPRASEVLSAEATNQLLLHTGVLPILQALPFFQFRTDARIELHRYGNYRQSIIASAAAAENLILTVLELLLWEEGMSPVQAVVKVGRIESILKRLKREMAPRLKGSWSEKDTGAVQDWHLNVLRVRNAVVHVGHEATRREALSALTALNSLVGHFADRFAVPEIQAKYPKTVILSLGQDSLARRHAWTSTLDSLSQAHAWEWRAEFGVWRSNVLASLPL